LQRQFLDTLLHIEKIETDNPNEARDLFVRLQAGMPLNSQEKRDAWPGQFTDFVLRLGGKAGLAKYPGHDFFNELMKARRTQDRGKFRQLAAQLAMLFFTHHDSGDFRDINAAAIDDYYYENLGFDANSDNASRLQGILDKINQLLRDQKRPKVIGHEAIHLVLLVDSLLDDYTRSWETNFPTAFDHFRANLAQAKQTRYEASPSEYWIRYGVGTRVNSDRGEVIHRRHEFFMEKMYEILHPQLKDPQRGFGTLEREIVYYRDKKRCAVCDAEVIWSEAEVHHIHRHSQGGKTTLDNGVMVHRHCHPKGATAEQAFAKKWRQRSSPPTLAPTREEVVAAAEDADDNGDA
jgi:5-methylcytosine-specific restriction endonuclease McrA